MAVGTAGVWHPIIAPVAYQFRLDKPDFAHHHPAAAVENDRYGEVPEWSNGLDSKSSVRFTVPWVRIPPSPPARNKNANVALFGEDHIVLKRAAKQLKMICATCVELVDPDRQNSVMAEREGFEPSIRY